MSPLRLGFVKYLNTLPLVEGLAASRDLELIAAVPSHLIDLLLSRQIDLGLVSLIDAATSPEPLAILPVGMIGCDGPTLTVRLYSRVPIDRLTTVCADTDSHTSTALLQVVLWKRYGLRVRAIGFDAREHVVVGGAPDSEWPEAVLLIGDKVVSDPPPVDQYPHQLDLGAAWKELTGLPFVYAAWMCRANEQDSTPIQLAAAILDRQRRRNAMRLDWLVGARAGDRNWPAEAARRYIGDLLRYDLDDHARGGADRFVHEAASLGLCAHRPLNWIETPAPALT
jgi:chorismate dehydratase